MIDRLAPLESGRDTEIDMIEREMEGGVVVIQPPEVHEQISAEEHVDVREFPKPSVVPKA